MKIIYSCSRSRSCNYQVVKFIREVRAEVKVCGYYSGSWGLEFADWTLDSMNHKDLIRDIDKWEPNLIISDGERMVAEIGAELGIRMWYCGGKWMMNGVEWKNKIERGYGSVCHAERTLIEGMPEAEKIMIPSAYGDIGVELREGYEWIRPYYGEYETIEGDVAIYSRAGLRESIDSLVGVDKRLVADRVGRWNFIGGGREEVAGLIYGGAGRICMSPELGDIESIMNSSICVGLGMGDDIGDVGRMRGEGMELIERSRRGVIGKREKIESKNKTIGEIINDII